MSCKLHFLNEPKNQKFNDARIGTWYNCSFKSDTNVTYLLYKGYDSNAYILNTAGEIYIANLTNDIIVLDEVNLEVNITKA